MNIDRLTLRLCQCGVACEQFIYPRAFVIVSDLAKAKWGHRSLFQIYQSQNEGMDHCFRFINRKWGHRSLFQIYRKKIKAWIIVSDLSKENEGTDHCFRFIKRKWRHKYLFQIYQNKIRAQIIVSELSKENEGTYHCFRSIQIKWGHKPLFRFMVRKWMHRFKYRQAFDFLV